MIGFSMMVVIVTGGPEPRRSAPSASARRWHAAGCSSALGLPLAAGARRRRSRSAALLGAVNGCADRPLRAAQLHHHAGDDEHLLRRDGLPHPCPGLSRPAARACRIRQDAARRLRLAAADRQHRRRSGPAVVLYRLTPLGRRDARRRRQGRLRRSSRAYGSGASSSSATCSRACSPAIAAMMVVARTRRGHSLDGRRSSDRTGCCRPSSAPVLGGTLLAGGRVSVLGTFLGAVLVSDADQRPAAMRIGEFWVQACLGLLLLLAVLMDLARRSLLARIGGAWRDDRSLLALSAHRLVRPARRHRGRPSIVHRRASTRPSCRRSTSRSCCSRSRSTCVIAMSQMVIIAIGQMNLAVGAIGGLAAICFAGLMQVWGLPPPLAAAAALAIGARRRPRQRLADRADRHLGLHHHAGQPVDLQGRRISASPARSRSTACPRA